MADFLEESGACDEDMVRAVQPPAASHPKKRRPANMHEGIGVWCDPCACEAEPYWAELAPEFGINLSDYEDGS